MIEKINPIIVKAKAKKLRAIGGVPGVLVFTNRVAYRVPIEVQRLIAGIV
jgi:hypothetical protein